MKNHLACCIALGLVALGGCTSTAPVMPPASLVVPDSRMDAMHGPNSGTQSDDNGGRILRQSETPRPGAPARTTGALKGTEIPEGLGTVPVTLNVQGLPVPGFVNEFFGNILKIPYRMSPEVASMTEVVSLSVNEPMLQSDAFRLARELLADQKVQLTVSRGIVEVSKLDDGGQPRPTMISNQQDIPTGADPSLPILQSYALEVVRASDAQRWLQSVFGSSIQAEADVDRNTIVLRGKPRDIEQAIGALKIFDAPSMRGRLSTRLEPAFIPASELADRLVEVLVAQGYGASRGLGTPASVLVLPIPQANTILLFGTSQRTLDFAVEWARELDRPNPTSSGPSFHYYQVRNTKAEEIAAILTGQSVSSSTNGTNASERTTSSSDVTSVSTVTSVDGATFTVDSPRNALIFRGDSATWQRTLPLIQQMDRAPRQVMVEVTIAEVTLSDDEQFGINWGGTARAGRFDGRFQLGALPNSDLNNGGGNSSPPETQSSSGFVYQLSVNGNVRARLNALANDNRISVLSTPRLMVKSGAEASIDVGNEIPTLTSQTVSGQQTGGSSTLLQGIQYRKTGILLNIKPTVYSDDRVDLEITQEVSEAQPVGSNSAVQSPAIFNRTVQTSLSLQDGTPHILGGLMSRRDSNGSGGIPGLKDVPLFGGLFRSRSSSADKTELVLIITPYIVEDAKQSNAIIEELRNQMTLIQLPETEEK